MTSKPAANLHSSSEDSSKAQSRALAKGLILLEAMAAHPRAMHLVELADAANLGKSSTLRLLNTLVATGFASRDSSGTYLLNRKWMPATREDSLRQIVHAATEPMMELNADLAETISLAAAFEDHIRVIHVVESPRQFRLSNSRHRIIPPYASSLGKAIAAHQPAEKLQVFLNVYGIHRFTEFTITEPPMIRKELQLVRERGYSTEYEETVVGGCCFGAPIRTGRGSVEASISVSLPVSRLTNELRERLPALVMDTAQRISEKAQL